MIQINYKLFLLKWATSSLRKSSSIATLAKMLRVGTSTLSMVENEKRRPGLELYLGMCIAAGLGPYDYVTGYNELIDESNKLHQNPTFSGKKSA